MYYSELLLVIILVLVLVYFWHMGASQYEQSKPSKKEGMSVLSQTKADGIRDRAGNTELDYDLTALMRTQTGLPVAV